MFFIYTVLYTIPLKVFQLPITTYIFKYISKYFCQLLWKSSIEYKIHLAEVIKIQNTFNCTCAKKFWYHWLIV